MDLYRLITAVDVRDRATRWEFRIQDSLGIVLSASKDHLAEKGIKSITEGQQFFIKGRYGNDDVTLASPNCLTDIRKA